MKDEALAIAGGANDPAQKLNLLREYVQVSTLRSLHESEAFVSLAFVGGTALRFVFALPRFSEDLDFSVEKHEAYEPESWMKKLKRDLSLAGFDVSIAWDAGKTVHTAWVKVTGLLQDARLAAMREQKLSIKIEIDTAPPEGSNNERRVITRHTVFSIQHHDLASLMADKIHALVLDAQPASSPPPDQGTKGPRDQGTGGLGEVLSPQPAIPNPQSSIVNRQSSDRPPNSRLRR